MIHLLGGSGVLRKWFSRDALGLLPGGILFVLGVIMLLIGARTDQYVVNTEKIRINLPSVFVLVGVFFASVYELARIVVPRLVKIKIKNKKGAIVIHMRDLGRPWSIGELDAEDIGEIESDVEIDAENDLS